MSEKPLARTKEIVVQDLKGETLIYDLNINKAYCLNETSSLVWQACDGNKSVAQISQILGKKFNQPADEDLVWLALDELKKENLLENGDEVDSKLKGISRREAIKKVGLATMIALPVISSLVAPKAIDAASLTCLCPLNEPAVCQVGGYYFIGCSYNDYVTCYTAAIASGGTPAAPKKCCNGADGSGYNVALKCCSVICK